MQRGTEPDRLITRQELADRLGVSDKTLKRMIEKGEFPQGVLHSGRRRWTETDWCYYLHFAGRWMPQRNAELPEKKNSDKKSAASQGGH